MFHAMDRLGMAQYLTRVGLLLADREALDEAKQAWLQSPVWQPLRRYVEDTFVLQDWFEQFVAQNLALDGLLYPLVYGRIDEALTRRAGPVLSMLTRFQLEWFEESGKWVDAQIKTAAAESAENRALLEGWLGHWAGRAREALAPVAQLALTEHADAMLSEVAGELATRAGKAGLKV
jgi:phenol hydroxylase P1 protein